MAPRPISPEEQRYRDTVAARNTPGIVIPNARHIASQRYRREPNWVLAKHLYCVGSNYAHGICRDAGLDPDATR